jgi:UDP-N-acetylmuramate-alanine ligase
MLGNELINTIVATSKPGDQILVMSNGGIHEKLLQRLE